MNIICFGLNCTAPEDLMESLYGMFTKRHMNDVDFQKELVLDFVFMPIWMTDDKFT